MSIIKKNKCMLLGGPCLRSKSSRSPPTEVSNAIEVYEPASSASREAWCAAHLNMLCTHALEAFKNFGNDGMIFFFFFFNFTLSGSIM